MTVVRRILLAIVTIALLVDASALAYLKINSGPKPSDSKSKVVFWIDDKGQADAAAEKLKEMDYEPLVKPAKRETFVQANFRLVHRGSRRELLEPIAKVLKKSGHKNLSFNEEGTELYYGGTYAKKADAKRVAKSLEAKELVIFEVIPGRKKVMLDSFRVILLEVPENYVDPITTALEESGEIEIADQVEESLDPPDEEEEEGEEVEEEDAEEDEEAEEE